MKTNIVLVIGPSGSGKSTLARMLEKEDVYPLVSHTTRKPRKEEVHGLDYYFVTNEAFLALDMIESTEYSGDHYGLSRQELEESNYEWVSHVLDKDGAAQLIEAFPEKTFPFWLDTKPSTMVARMKHRGDDMDTILERVAYAVETSEFNVPEFKHIVLSDDISIEDKANEIMTIINYELF